MIPIMKVYGNEIVRYESIKGLFGGVEVLAPIDFEPESLKKYEGEIVAIHAGHSASGFNPCDSNCEKINGKIIDIAKKAADISDANTIVFHPGFYSGSREECNDKAEDNMLRFIEENYDDRLSIENLPSEAKRIKFVFPMPEEIESLMKKLNIKFTLDFSHAICTANIVGSEPMKMIEDFKALSPNHYHVSGVRLDSKIDTHLNLYEVFGNGNDFEYLRNLPLFSNVVIETGNPITSTPDSYAMDVKILQKF